MVRMDALGPITDARSSSVDDDASPREVVELRAAFAAAHAREAALITQVHEHQQLVEGLSRHVPGGLIVLNLLADGRRTISYASDGVYTLFDIAPDVTDDPEVLFHTLVSRVHPDYLPQIALWEAATAMGEPELAGDFLIVRTDGEERWIALQAGIQVDGEERRTWYGMLQDVTARRKMARKLNERDALLKSLSQNLPGMLFKLVTSDEKTPRLTYVSAQVRELFELSDDLERDNWHQHYALIHPDDLPLVQSLMNPKLRQSRVPVSFEYRVQLPTKGVRWVAGQAMPMSEAQGKVAWYGYIADVTEHKLYVDALMSVEAAEQANHAKSDFLSRMSHELRTPLNAILGFAQLLRMERGTVFGETQHQHVRQIEKAGQHLLSVLSDVLDLSRIEGGSLPLSIAPQDCLRVIDDAVQLVSDLARRHQITVHLPHRHAPVGVLADRVRLRQVLVNLLVNAIKYNRPGGQVRLGCWQEGDRIFVEVSDTGIGLNETQLARLFEPFNRLGAEQLGIDGTGIGLVIVHRLVSMMDGDIQARSQPEQGSVFQLSLPAAEEAPMESGAMPLGDEVTGSRKHATILYAEDNEVNVMLVQEVMRLRPHWHLQVGRSGAQALALAHQAPPDLMLVDMHLGDMSGFDLADALDRDGRLRTVPRVALSADAMPDRIHAAQQRGFKAYLTKPLDVLALLRCLDECLPSN